MKMKRIGITVALLFCMGTGSLFAQAYKVVEKSDKKAPVWYESAESGYIVAYAETGSLLLLQEGLAVSHGTGRYARERNGRWREKIRSLWMKHIGRRDARELNATEGGPQAPYGHQQQG